MATSPKPRGQTRQPGTRLGRKVVRASIGVRKGIRNLKRVITQMRLTRHAMEKLKRDPEVYQNGEYHIATYAIKQEHPLSDTVVQLPTRIRIYTKSGWLREKTQIDPQTGKSKTIRYDATGRPIEDKKN